MYPFYKQLDRNDCGPCCIRMICRYHGKTLKLDKIRKESHAGRMGTSLWHLSNAATNYGMRTLYAKVPFEDLTDATLPCVVHWQGNHFVVVYKITRSKVIVGDPAIGIIKYTHAEFIERWARFDNEGIVLLMEPTPKFYQLDSDSKIPIGFSFFYLYLKPFKKYYLQIILGMVVSLILSLIIPFLTQAVVDVGITNKNLGFITLVMVAQLVFSISTTIMGFIRSWIFLHVGTRISIAIISDYLIKLLRLPVSFFDSKTLGDITQRIGDHGKIQAFVSSTTLSTLFSFVNFFVFAGIMAYYNLKLLLIFLFFSTIYSLWIVLFLKKRKEFNYKFFERSALRQNNLIQLLYGVRDIKLHNYEDRKRWEWERIQAETFKISIKQLVINQYQQAGAFFIETSKGLVISYLTARAVVNGEMTLGMMMSTQYILGQISSPISQLIGLINSYQDARISLERIGEIHDNEDEEKYNEVMHDFSKSDRGIRFEDVSFSYTGSKEDLVLKNVSFEIPEGKTTAIVGASGSGKTTVLKLLLKFYPVTSGNIYVGSTNLRQISHRAWREECGAVLQDGYIFSDSVAENLALGDEEVSLEKLEYAATIANIDEFIKSLPQGYNTKIGIDGVGLSQGQRQRILISRSVYKDSHYLFFDEATNALDSNNEGIILENINNHIKDKTVVVIAHRLSTIRHADQIIVIDKGEVAETGNHSSLLELKGKYYDLIKKQTELLTV